MHTSAPERGQPERIRAIQVPGTWGYVDRLGVRAGGVVRCHVSAPAEYEFSIVRLGTTALLDPTAGEQADRADVEVLYSARHAPSPQSISPGSYIYVDGSPVPARPLTLAVWLRLWRLPTIDTFQWNWSGIITDFDYPEACRFGLLVDHTGRITTYVGDGGLFRTEWLHRTATSLKDGLGTWRHLVATIGADDVRMYLDGSLAYHGTHTVPNETAPGRAARLRIGASAERGAAHDFLDGDIALPFIAHGTLDEAGVRSLAANRGRTNARELGIEALLGYWPLAEERGVTVADASRHGRHGRIVNHATWQIGGPASDPAQGVPGYDPTADPNRGHALRLSSDDLVDCGWPATDEFSIPPDAPAGLYAGRVCLAGQNSDTALHIPFAVVRLQPRARDAIALLIATNTWHAYGRIPRDEMRVPGLTSSYYTRHLNGRPFFHVGVRAPIPHADPYGFESLRAAHTRHSHLVRPERFAQAWLTAQGYPFECITDLDLHAEPSLLGNFRMLLICGHNEYWSDAMRDGVLAYLRAGGRVLCLSGNTLYWRVSFDADLSVLECRKTSESADGEWLPPAEWGERWHSQDGRAGGDWRLIGQPTHEVLGLTMQGMIDDGTPAAFAAYHVLAPGHVLFNEPERVPITAQGTIGEQCLNGPKASGYEMDATPQTVGITGAPVPGVVTLASALGQHVIEYEGATVYHGADLIYWARSDGGQVVNAGSIGFSGALAVDPGVQALIRNVLYHFGVPRQGPSVMKPAAGVTDAAGGQ